MAIWIGRSRTMQKKSALRITYAFWGGRDDVIELYQAMDVFFRPSLFEGLPVTGIEAQAMGLPMVVSDTVTNEMVYTDLVDYVSLSTPLFAWAARLQAALSKGSAGGVCRKIEGKPFLGCAVRGTSDGDLSADAGWKIM